MPTKLMPKRPIEHLNLTMCKMTNSLKFAINSEGNFRTICSKLNRCCLTSSYSQLKINRPLTLIKIHYCKQGGLKICLIWMHTVEMLSAKPASNYNRKVFVQHISLIINQRVKLRPKNVVSLKCGFKNYNSNAKD